MAQTPVHAREPETTRRPFYLIGHNTNTIKDVHDALDAGANAIEPDVNVYEDNPQNLCISHDKGDANAPSLSRFLTDLHHVAESRPELCLVYLDCKPDAATAKHGSELLNAVRTLLTFDTNLNIILSVSTLTQTAVFDQIKAGLLSREGLMIDQECDPVEVSDAFASRGVANHGYGNGSSIMNRAMGPLVRPSMERCCELRAGTNSPRFISVWTVRDHDLMREYIHIGVDGMITDTTMSAPGAVCHPMADLRKIVDASPSVRAATRDDDPFRPANFAYGLKIHTGDVCFAGTDTRVTFTLHGPNGNASHTIDTDLIGRCERDGWDFVSILSPDLGALQSITVQRDNVGPAPDWFLDSVLVRSFRFGVSKEAVFSCWIDTTSPFTRAFG